MSVFELIKAYYWVVLIEAGRETLAFIQRHVYVEASIGAGGFLIVLLINGSPSSSEEWLIQLSPLIVLAVLVSFVAVSQLTLAPARLHGAQGAIIATLYKRRDTDTFIDLLADYIRQANVLYRRDVANDEEVAALSQEFNALVNGSLVVIEQYFNKAGAVILDNELRESFEVKQFKRGISDRHNHFLTINERYRARLANFIHGLRYTNTWDVARN